MGRRSWATGLTMAVLIAIPSGASGQHRHGDRDRSWDDEDWGPPTAEFSIFGLGGLPQGDFNNFVDAGGGLGVSALAFLNDSRTLAIRLEGSGLAYGRETFRVPLSPTIPFVDVDVSTTNYIASLGIGPQVYFGRGTIRPYVFGTVGFSYFATQTSVSGSNEIDSFASTTNFDDFTMSMTGGGGLSLAVSDGEHPVALDLSAAYVRNGLAEYLTKGDLVEFEGGGWGVNPIVSETNMLSIRVGVSIGVR